MKLYDLPDKVPSHWPAPCNSYTCSRQLGQAVITVVLWQELDIATQLPLPPTGRVGTSLTVRPPALLQPNVAALVPHAVDNVCPPLQEVVCT